MEVKNDKKNELQNQLQKNETREELKARLKQKINNKKNTRTNGITRKKGENINNSLKKITEILANKNIQNTEQIDSTLIETIMSVISKNDLEIILEKIQENSKFREILQEIKDKSNENKINENNTNENK